MKRGMTNHTVSSLGDQRDSVGEPMPREDELVEPMPQILEGSLQSFGDDEPANIMMKTIGDGEATQHVTLGDPNAVPMTDAKTAQQSEAKAKIKMNFEHYLDRIKKNEDK
jgi:hypothetical protein